MTATITTPKDAAATYPRDSSSKSVTNFIWSYLY